MDAEAAARASLSAAHERPQVARAKLARFPIKLPRNRQRRPSRFAFARAFRSQGPSKVVAATGGQHPSRKAVSEAAVAFSCTIRRYSAGEHVPLAIITDRSAIVWAEATPRLIRVEDSEGLGRSFGINPTWGAGRPRPEADHNLLRSVWNLLASSVLRRNVQTALNSSP